ncbi:MAG: hypothetical protein Fur0037_02070 [Planctomycetota bacterium]
MARSDPPLDEVLRLVARANRERPGTGEAERILEDLFGCSQRLLVYGSLAPGEANHREVASCRGTWRRVLVRGWKGMRRWPVFRCDPEAQAHDLLMLTSPDLPARWRRLDEFEGPEYRRILAPAFEGSDLLAVGNLYEALIPF